LSVPALVNPQADLQGESRQAELQKAEAEREALAGQMQQALEQGEKQRQGLEAKLQLHGQEESGLLAGRGLCHEPGTATEPDH